MLERFCMVLLDLFSDGLAVRLKRNAELSTDLHLVGCFLQFSKPWPNRKSNRSSVTCRIKWEALKDKEVRKQFTFSISSKFKQLPEAFEDMEKEWLLLRSAIILSAAESCGRKRLIEDDDSEKKGQDRQISYRTDRSSSDLQSRYTEKRQAATLAVKKFREKSC